MKKTALTFVALAFGMGVSFAQTAPQTDNAAASEQAVAVEKLSAKPEEAGRRAIKVEELPAAVQEQLKNQDLSALTIVSVTEVQPQADAQAGVQYEVALLENTAEATAEPSLVILFDDKGQQISRTEASAAKVEE